MLFLEPSRLHLDLKIQAIGIVELNKDALEKEINGISSIQSSVNELGTALPLNDWVVNTLQPGPPCFFQLQLDL